MAPKCLLAALLLAGCSSLTSTTTSELGGIGGAAIARAVTADPLAVTGIGLGVQAGTHAGTRYAQKNVHRETQDEIARAAAPLRVGEVAHWQSHHTPLLERNEHGEVTVSRLIGSGDLHCKEAVFSVDSVTPRAFYVTVICRDGATWRWATAEPATERWGALQ
jgi:hypothetical protein